MQIFKNSINYIINFKIIIKQLNHIYNSELDQQKEIFLI